MMRSYGVGGEWEGEQEPEKSWTVGDSCSQQLRSAVSLRRSMEDGEEAQWRRKAVLLVLELLM